MLQQDVKTKRICIFTLISNRFRWLLLILILLVFLQLMIWISIISWLRITEERLRKYFAGTVMKTNSVDATREFLHEMNSGIESKTYFPYVLIDNTLLPSVMKDKN